MDWTGVTLRLHAIFWFEILGLRGDERAVGDMLSIGKGCLLV